LLNNSGEEGEEQIEEIGWKTFAKERERLDELVRMWVQ